MWEGACKRRRLRERERVLFVERMNEGNGMNGISFHFLLFSIISTFFYFLFIYMIYEVVMMCRFGNEVGNAMRLTINIYISVGILHVS